MSNGMRSMTGSNPMVALTQPRQLPVCPRDTGAVFNGNVRVWLFTNDPTAAAQCGARLHTLGLPQQHILRLAPAGRWEFAINPNVAPRMVVRPDGVRGIAHVPLCWAGHPMILETQDAMDLQRFYNWLHAKNPNVPKPEQPPSLEKMADEGEIETIE